MKKAGGGGGGGGGGGRGRGILKEEDGDDYDDVTSCFLLSLLCIFLSLLLLPPFPLRLSEGRFKNSLQAEIRAMLNAGKMKVGDVMLKSC